MSNIYLYDIAEKFAFDASATDIRPLGEGFINDTYIVTTDKSRYILQRKNHIVFPDVEEMMDNIWRVTTHLKAKVKASSGDPRRMPILPLKRRLPIIHGAIPSISIIAAVY